MSPLRLGDRVVILAPTTIATLIREGGAAHRVAGLAPSAGVVLRVRPVPGFESAADGEAVVTDTPLALVAEDGTYLQRTSLMYDDGHWGTGRFELGFAPECTQHLTFTRGGLVKGPVVVLADVEAARDPETHVGLSFAGLLCGRGHRTHPANSDRRLLTLRPHDQPTCVVDQWNDHERLVLVRAA